MKNLNDTNTRMQLVSRYLNAETTLEEEQLLRQYYTQTEDALNPEESDVRQLILSSASLAGEFALSEEKADEFDRLMAKRAARRNVSYWIASATAAAAAVVIAFFLLTYKQAGDASSLARTEESPATRQRGEPARRSADAVTEQYVNDIMSAANYSNEQVESYRLRPVGDATVVTKTLADGTSSSCIICLSDDDQGFHVVPINTGM